MTSEEEQKQFRIKWNAMLFGVRRSIRYHSRRRKFFDALSVWADFLIIISGGTAVAFAVGDPQKNEATAILGGIIAIICTLDLVIGFKTKARDYHDLVRDFSALERKMTTFGGDKRTKEKLAEFTNERLEIEENEPPILRVLNNYCHNELCRAEEHKQEDYYRISLFQSICKEWFDWRPASMKRYGDIPTDKGRNKPTSPTTPAPVTP